MVTNVRMAVTLDTVEAQVVESVSLTDLQEAQRLWSPVLRGVVLEFRARGRASGIKVWQGEWGTKEALLKERAFSIQGIRIEGRIQGLIKMVLEGQDARLPSSHGRGIVYVDLVEVAPWNVKGYMNALGRWPVYRDVGQALIRLAVAESDRQGMEGRIGLHSVPSAERFYEKLGLTPMGPDPDKEGLAYFELGADMAKWLLER